MISMTGYGNCEFQNDKILISMELKSINSKFFESNIKIPYLFSSEERKIVEILKNKLIRGRINFTLNYKLKDSDRLAYGFDESKLKNHLKLLDQINAEKNLSDSVSIKDILNFQDIIVLDREVVDAEIIELLYTSLENVIQQNNDFREKEGNIIEQDILKSIQNISESVNEIESIWESKKNEYHDMYHKKIQDVFNKYDLNNDRLFQEVAIILDKRDINEEIVRLKSHLESFVESLKKYHVLGKRLIFLLQELFREVNTVASKSEYIEINEKVIDIKSDLEKIKEQVQNIL